MILFESCGKIVHYFKKTKDLHVYDTRGKSELYVCVQNLAISRQNPLSCCPKFYNLLPVSIRAEHIFSRFETALKTFVRQRKFYTFEDYYDYMKNLLICFQFDSFANVHFAKGDFVCVDGS